MSLEVYPQSGPPGPVGPTASVLFSAGTLSAVRSDITFNNGSGVTFGLDAGGVITASVQTNYQSAGAYLTTAALSQDSSKYAGTTAGMTGGSLTVDTAGVAISLPAYLTTAQPPGAYLTTAMASNRGSDFVQATAGFFGTNATGTIASNAISISVNPGGGGSLNISAGTTSSSVSAVTFSNGSGVTFGFDGSNVTASVQTNYQTPGAYLTTAALSQDSSKYAGTGFISASTAGSNIVGTLNTSGLSVGIPNYLTTAQPPGAYLTTAALSQDSSKYAGTNGSVETTSGTDLALTLNTSGATIAYPKWLTTAQPPGAYLTTAALSQDSSKYAGTGFTTATTAGTNVVGTLNNSGLSMGIPAYLTTTPAGGAGTGFTSTSTAGSNVVGTLNSNGLSVGVPNYLTTAMASDAVTLSNINVLAGTTNRNLSSFALASKNNIAFGFAGTGTATNDITASWAMAVVNSAGVGDFNAQDLRFDDSNGVSWGISTNGGTTQRAFITASVRTDYAGTNTSLQTTSGTDLKVTLNTTGLTIAYPAWLTTAGGAAVVQSLNGSTGQLSISGSGLNSVSNNASTIVVSARSESLNEIQNPAADAVFSMGSNAAFFSYNAGGSFTTNATREGMFQISVAGNVTQEADVFRLWQGGGAPSTLDMLHIEAGGTNVTALRLQNSCSVAGEFNNPIKFTTADTNFAIGSVPMILGTGMSNLVSNLNANYLQGKQSSDFAATNITSARAGTNTSVATTSGTDLTLGVNTSGVTIGYPKWLTTAAATDITSGRAGTNTSVATTSGTDLTLGVNTSGVTIGYPKWLTTAAATNVTSACAGTNTSVATTSGTDLTLGVNTSGVTIGYPKWITTYVNDLTSQRAGTNTSVATTSGTDLSFVLNTSGETIAYPKWITTWTPGIVGVSNSQTVFTTGTVAFSEGGGAITIASSAGGQSLMFSVPQTSSLVGTNGISISTTGSTISVSNIGPNISAGTTSTNQSNYTFSNANGISFGIGTGASVGVITASIATSLSVVNFSAAGSSNNLGSVVFSNSNGVSFGLNGSTITANAGTNAGTNTAVSTTAGSDITIGVNTSGVTIGYPKWLTTAAQSSALASYWCNLQEVQGTSSFSLQSNSVNVQPFMLPYPISMSYVRVPVSFANLTSTTVAATAGSTSFYYYQSINAVLYSQGAGANSRSLQYLTSSQAAFTEAFLFSISNAGTNESIAYQITYPVEGNNTANSATTMLTTAGGASIFLHTTGGMTNFTGIHHLDIPMAISLSAGNYWIAFNRSTNSTTSGGGINITGNVNRAHTFIVCTQINSNFVPLGFASGGAATASTQPVWQIGLGSHSVSAQGATTSSLALSSVSSVANFPVIPMQFIRQA